MDDLPFVANIIFSQIKLSNKKSFVPEKNKVFKNKSLADKFKHMELDRQLEKEETASQDNIFPENQANVFLNFGK